MPLTKKDILDWQSYLNSKISFRYCEKGDLKENSLKTIEEIVSGYRSIFGGRVFTRGQKKEENVIVWLDLHGLTLDKAYKEVLCFIDYFVKHSNIKSVGIITGCGSLFNNGQSSIRRELPLWLSCGNASKMVSKVVEAPKNLGGKGAFLVKFS